VFLDPDFLKDAKILAIGGTFEADIGLLNICMDFQNLHAWLNDLIHRALVRAKTPAVNEPQGLSREDGKTPDGLTLAPWQSRRSAMWDVTVAYTLATSYVSQNALQVEVLQRPRLAERQPSTVRSPLVTCFFSGDSWSLVRRGSQLHCRYRQKSHALYSRSSRTSFL